GRRGMVGKHTYPSHRLRYALKGPGESDTDFRRRVSDEVQRPVSAGRSQPFESDENWLLGFKARQRGSLHCDIWRGQAVDLAKCGKLAVFPTAGWWKTHARQDRVGRPVSYALLVSLATPEIATDLYTPVAAVLNRVSVPHQLSLEVGIPG